MLFHVHVGFIFPKSYCGIYFHFLVKFMRVFTFQIAMDFAKCCLKVNAFFNRIAHCTPVLFDLFNKFAYYDMNC